MPSKGLGVGDTVTKGQTFALKELRSSGETEVSAMSEVHENDIKGRSGQGSLDLQNR
jgi:hypothetical protein